jgi:hypothetical protein
MWYKVAWLFLWMTLAFWAGCAGENQNYEINKQDIDTFQPPPEGGPAAPGGSASVITAGDVAVSAADEIPAQAPAADKSVTGLARDTWTPLTIAPVDGGVPHHPRYFGNSWGDSVWGVWRVTADRPSPLLNSGGAGDIEAEAALATGHSRWTFTCDEPADLGLNIAKFALDAVTLPGSIVASPPWGIHTSPAE